MYRSFTAHPHARPKDITMVILKNRTGELRTYQFSRSVSGGPVRPKTIRVHRGRHNPRTGEKGTVERPITVGGVLTLLPNAASAPLPDWVVEHPVIARDLKNRKLSSTATAVEPRRKEPARLRRRAKPVEAQKPVEV